MMIVSLLNLTDISTALLPRCLSTLRAIGTEFFRWDVCSLNICLSMMTSSNGNIFRVDGPLCGEFTDHRPVMRSFDAFFEQTVEQIIETPVIRAHYDVTVRRIMSDNTYKSIVSQLITGCQLHGVSPFPQREMKLPPSMFALKRSWMINREWGVDPSMKISQTD